MSNPQPSARQPVPWAWSALGLIFVVFLYGWVGFHSYGYDDEFYTIKYVTESATPSELIYTLATRDVHPPGSYLTVWALDQLGVSFSVMRLLMGAIVATSLWALWRAVSEAEMFGATLGYMLICLNPTILLWGATLRWYSHSLPLAIGMFLLVRGGGRLGAWNFWGLFGLLSVLLGYMGYYNVLLMPALLGCALWSRRARLGQEWPTIVLLGVLSVALILPLALWMVPGQMVRGMGPHDTSLLRTVGGAILHVFGGQSSMPLGLAAIVFALCNILLLLSAALRRQLHLGSSAAIVTLTSVGLALLGGLSGHFRSMVMFSPFQAVWQHAMFPRAGWLRAVLFCSFALATSAGLINVITHRETSKGNWNAPTGEALAAIEAQMAQCRNPAVFTYDPALVWHLQDRGHKVLTVERWTPDPEGALNAHKGCLVLVRSHHRMLDAAFETGIQNGLKNWTEPHTTIELGFDRHAAFKRRFDDRIPDIPIILYYYDPQ